MGPGFQHVDGSTDPKFFVRYLDAVSALEAARKYKQCTIDLLRVGPGDRVLDVVTAGDFISAETPIVVSQIDGMRVVVTRASAQSAIS